MSPGPSQSNQWQWHINERRLLGVSKVRNYFPNPSRNRCLFRGLRGPMLDTMLVQGKVLVPPIHLGSNTVSFYNMGVVNAASGIIKTRGRTFEGEGVSASYLLATGLSTYGENE